MDWNLEEAIAYYGRQGAPRDQSALTALLREIQRENGGGIPRGAVTAAARAYGIPESIPQAQIRRIPGLRLEDCHLLEICSGPNCPRKKDLESVARKILQENPGAFRLRTVGCMRLCGKGPNIRWDGQLYSGADEALLRQLTQKARK